MGLVDILGKLFGNKSARDIREIAPVLGTVIKAYENIQKLSNDELRAKTQELKTEFIPIRPKKKYKLPG